LQRSPRGKKRQIRKIAHGNLTIKHNAVTKLTDTAQTAGFVHKNHKTNCIMRLTGLSIKNGKLKLKTLALYEIHG